MPNAIYQFCRLTAYDFSSKICQSIRNLQDHLDTQQKNDSTPAIVAGIENIQRDIHASNSRFEASVFDRLDAIEQRTARMPPRTSTSVKIAFQSVLFNFSVDFSSEREDQVESEVIEDTTVTQTVCTIRLPRWFVSEQHNLMVKRAKNGWLYSPALYREVNDSCPFFNACRKGNLDTVRVLNQAFLSDRGPSAKYADSALVAAIDGRQVEVCKFLVNAGIKSFFQDSDYTIALVRLVVGLSTDKPEINQNILRLIEPRGNSDCDWPSDFVNASRARKVLSDIKYERFGPHVSRLVRFEASVFAFRALLGDITMSSLSLESMDADLSEEIRTTGPSCAWLVFVLAECVADHELDRSFFIRANNYLYYIRALRNCTGAGLHTTLDDLPDYWQQRLSEKINLAPEYVTPFIYVVLWHWSDPRSASAKMRRWLHCLDDAGIDLLDYAEEEVWRLEDLMGKITKMNGLYGLSYGRNPEDWGFLTSPPGEAYPECFWYSLEESSIRKKLAAKMQIIINQVERPDALQCKVPGSWEDLDERRDWLEPACERWLEFKSDEDLAQLEIDIEEQSAEVFYEENQLDFITEDIWGITPGSCWSWGD